jgi:hypothetical protein
LRDIRRSGAACGGNGPGPTRRRRLHRRMRRWRGRRRGWRGRRRGWRGHRRGRLLRYWRRWRRWFWGRRWFRRGRRLRHRGLWRGHLGRRWRRRLLRRRLLGWQGLWLRLRWRRFDSGRFGRGRFGGGRRFLVRRCHVGLRRGLHYNDGCRRRCLIRRHSIWQHDDQSENHQMQHRRRGTCQQPAVRSGALAAGGWTHAGTSQRPHGSVSDGIKWFQRIAFYHPDGHPCLRTGGPSSCRSEAPW